MERRSFLRNTLMAGGSMIVPAQAFSLANVSNHHPILNAYYFRAHMYTIVPHQVKEDMKWMAGAGTKVVSIAILEQDLWAAESNIEIICESAEKEGMEVWAVPSRWGGLVAGAPKVPSLFSAGHPDTWILESNGKPLISKNSAVISSIYHPDTLRFFCESAGNLLSKFPVTGLIWDEPKAIGAEDFSPAAKKVLGNHSTYEERVKHHARFFSSVNTYLRQRHPRVQLSLFTFANSGDTVVNTMATIKPLDYYGCDGRPWSVVDGGEMESAGKTLLDNAGRFIRAAAKNNIKSLLLMENHNLKSKDFHLLQSGIPQVIALQPDQLIYYFYPRNVSNPEKAMEIIEQQVKNF